MQDLSVFLFIFEENSMSRETEKLYEVPEEMRTFAVKSVAQARKAFDGFISATHKAVDASQNSSQSAQSSMSEITKKTIAFAEQNVAAAFDLVQKLVSVKEPSDVLKHVADYQRDQVASLQAQMKDVGSVVQKSATETASQMQRSASEATATLRSVAGEASEAMQNVVVEAAKRKTA
jgi:phasin